MCFGATFLELFGSAHHLQFFLRWVARLQFPSWTSLLTLLGASHFGGMAPIFKSFIIYRSGRGGCILKSKSCYVASMDFFWPTARTFARMVSEGAGMRGARLRCGAANGLAQPGWMRPKKDAGHGPVGHAIPHLPSPASSAHPFLRQWPSTPSVAEEAAGLLQLQRWWMQSVASWAWAGCMSQLSVLQRAAVAPSGRPQHICLLLGPTNSPLLVRPGQTDSGGTKRLIVPTKQIASKQALVEIARANSDIGHINLQSGSQQESHASRTYDLDHSSIGARDILGRLLSHGQPVGIHPLLGQQGDGCTRVNHQEALSGLALGLVTPCDLPRSNADRDVWLMSWLLLGFGWLRPRLGHLEPARRHTYLLDDEGSWAPSAGRPADWLLGSSAWQMAA